MDPLCGKSGSLLEILIVIFDFLSLLVFDISFTTSFRFLNDCRYVQGTGLLPFEICNFSFLAFSVF